jgi:hypothetical protein
MAYFSGKIVNGASESVPLASLPGPELEQILFAQLPSHYLQFGPTSIVTPMSTSTLGIVGDSPVFKAVVAGSRLPPGTFAATLALASKVTVIVADDLTEGGFAVSFWFTLNAVRGKGYLLRPSMESGAAPWALFLDSSFRLSLTLTRATPSTLTLSQPLQRDQEYHIAFSLNPVTSQQDVYTVSLYLDGILAASHVAEGVLYAQNCLDDVEDANVLAKYVPTATPWQQGWQRLSENQIDHAVVAGGVSFQTDAITTGMAQPLVLRELIDMTANGFTLEMAAKYGNVRL